MLADVRLAEKPEGLLTVNGTGDAFVFIAPFGDGWYRVMGWDRLSQRPDTDPIDLADVRDIARRALGTDYGMYEARWLSRFHSDERQAAHTASAASSSPATPPTSTPPPAARA